MNETLWKLSVTTSAEAEEAIVALLAEIFQRQPSVYTDQETKRSSVTIYFEQKPVLSNDVRRRLGSGLAYIKRCGLAVGSGRLSLKRLRPENWAESWKRHFKPIEVGSRLLVKPSWSRRPAKYGQKMVILDPGLSFGTGQHATTRFCLGELVRLQDPRASQAFLDVGTGSGILAIAAAKLGYKPVNALDYDPEAVAVARDNARRNRVDALIRFRREDITKPSPRSPRAYDVICANLIANVLLDCRVWLVNQLKPGGVLVVAGILRTEFQRIRDAYESLGLRLISRRSEKEWYSASFVGPKYAGIPKWPKKP